MYLYFVYFYLSKWVFSSTWMLRVYWRLCACVCVFVLVLSPFHVLEACLLSWVTEPTPSQQHSICKRTVSLLSMCLCAYQAEIEIHYDWGADFLPIPPSHHTPKLNRYKQKWGKTRSALSIARLGGIVIVGDAVVLTFPRRINTRGALLSGISMVWSCNHHHHYHQLTVTFSLSSCCCLKRICTTSCSKKTTALEQFVACPANMFLQKVEAKGTATTKGELSLFNAITPAIVWVVSLFVCTCGTCEHPKENTWTNENFKRDFCGEVEPRRYICLRNRPLCFWNERGSSSFGYFGGT